MFRRYSTFSAVGAVVISLLLVSIFRTRSRFSRLEAAFASQGASLHFAVAHLSKGNPDAARLACIQSLTETVQLCESEKLSGEETAFFLSAMRDSLPLLKLNDNEKEHLKQYIEKLEGRR